MSRVACACVGTKPGTKPVICPHHNYIVCDPAGCSEWDYTKNIGVTPDKCAPGSNKKYWFKCVKCALSYDQSLGARGRGARCPYCCGKKVSEYNNLHARFPEIANEWDYERNGNKTPRDYTSHSNSKAHWICKKEIHRDLEEKCFRWYAKISNRTSLSRGCPACYKGYEQMTGGLEIFVKRAIEVHGKKYDYSKSIYKSSTEKLTIICNATDSNGKMHGEFYQKPDAHINAKKGCHKCSKGYDQKIGGHEVFVADARKIHGHKYDYPDPYIRSYLKIRITCKSIGKNGIPHGDFEQTPNDHKSGGYGCPKCSVEQHDSVFSKNIIQYFLDCGFIIGDNIHLEWTDSLKLKYVNPLRIDICLPAERLLIEIDGQQHFKFGWHDASVSDFEKRLIKDFIKDAYTINNGMSILRIPYTCTMDEAKILINKAVYKCRTGQRIYYSYDHFIREAIRNKLDLSSLELGSVPCQSLKI